MRNVDIAGIGIISSLGITPQEVWGALCKDAPASDCEKISFPSFLPPAKRRRTDRFSDMAVYTAVTAAKDADFTPDEKTGTVYTTSYGPLTGSLSFAKKVTLGDPDICSPTVFSGTVPNACVGQICMHLNCKGPSTVLTASNNIGYTQMLLSSGKTTEILTGAIDEYNEDLFSALKERYPLPVPYREGAVSFLTTISSSKKYCTVVDFAECYLGGYPPFDGVEVDFAKNLIEKTVLSVPSFREVDAMLCSDAGLAFDQVEQEALSVLGAPKIITGLKKRLGETLGCAYNMNVAIGALILKHGFVPPALGENVPVSSLLVTGYDLSGNYTITLLKK